MEEILFTKMHGLGNDYVYINCLESAPRHLQQLAIEMSRPHTGIGSDGIILICPSDVADFKMRIFNADGSEARMCGNGSRCVGKYVHDYGLTDKLHLTLETLGGIKTIDLHPGVDGSVEEATVDMGEPLFDTALVPVISDAQAMIDRPVATSCGELRLTAVSMGNPHGVIFADAPCQLPVGVLGPELERHPMWPERANIEFVTVIDERHLRMRVWERGSGETMACGTGACASVAAAIAAGRVSRDAEITVSLPGGDLKIRMNSAGHLLMTGPATTVFEGRYFRRTESSAKINI